MHIVDPRIDAYLDDLARADDPVVAEMERLAAERGFPIVGAQVGRLLLALAVAAGARRVFELGSGFGYSAWWLARAVGPRGRVVLTEHSADLARRARGFLERAGYADRVDVQVGDGLDLASEVAPGTFDVVFNDAEKEDYPRALDVARRLLRPGGLFVTDNALWYGRVLAPPPGDATTAGVVALTRALVGARDFATTILPVRDGVAVAVKLPGDEER